MRIGIVGGSMKPVTRGHWALIQRAAVENDRVLLFVSASDRGGSDGEALVTGSRMIKIWKDHLLGGLPPSVKFDVVVSPIRRIYEVLGEASESLSTDSYVVYSDPEDIANRFSIDKQSKYFPNLVTRNLVSFTSVPRDGENAVSATQLRKLIEENDKDNGMRMLPTDVDREAIWALLSGCSHGKEATR